MTEWTDVFYTSSDGLTLYARDYPEDNAPLTVLCMHGLTRNSADFADIAAHLHQRYRVISVDQRGRGRSQWDSDPAHYVMPRYVEDMWTLLDHLGVEQVVLVGTSMGGLMSMLMAAQKPERIKGAVLNDIGPVIEQKGIDRLKGYVGKTRPVTTWDEAAETVRSINAAFYPDFTEADWMAFARRTYGEDENSVPVLAYDPAISQGVDADNTDSVPADLWPVYEMLGAVPLLVVRGALSDILSAETAAQMVARHPDCQAIALDRVGHAPFLMEPAARAAIDGFLQRLE